MLTQYQGGTDTLSVHRILPANAAWTEGTGWGEASGDGATWNTIDGTTPWAGSAGCGTAGTDGSTTPLWTSTSPNTLAGAIIFDLDLTEFALMQANNAGMVIFNDSTAVSNLYRSSDYGTAADHPRLEVYYDCVTPVATNAPSALTTPTYDGSGQAVHPDVSDAGAGNTWNGYRYWMVMTPYPSSDASKKNPSILVSDDGDTWSVPAGLTNPIQATPEAGNNADPALIMSPDATTLSVLFSNGSNGWKVKFSTDGVTWGAAQAATGTIAGLSPAILWDGSRYVMWGLDYAANPNLMRRQTAPALTGPWSAPATCTLTGMPAGIQPWHLTF